MPKTHNTAQILMRHSAILKLKTPKWPHSQICFLQILAMQYFFFTKRPFKSEISTMFSTLLIFPPIFVFIHNIIFLVYNPIPISTSYFFFFSPIFLLFMLSFSSFFLVQFFFPPLNSIDLSFVILMSFWLWGFFFFFNNPRYLLVVLKILAFWVDECYKLGWVSHANYLTNLPIFCLSKKRICLIYFYLENLKTAIWLTKLL